MYIQQSCNIAKDGTKKWETFRHLPIKFKNMPLNSYFPIN